jgi:hypothetical protein
MSMNVISRAFAQAELQHWLVVQKCLVKFHNLSPVEAQRDCFDVMEQLVSLKEGCEPDCAYHDEPFNVSCDLAGKPLKLEAHHEEYNVLLSTCEEQVLAAPQHVVSRSVIFENDLYMEVLAWLGLSVSIIQIAFHYWERVQSYIYLIVSPVFLGLSFAVFFLVRERKKVIKDSIINRRSSREWLKREMLS